MDITWPGLVEKVQQFHTVLNPNNTEGGRADLASPFCAVPSLWSKKSNIPDMNVFGCNIVLR